MHGLLLGQVNRHSSSPGLLLPNPGGCCTEQLAWAVAVPGQWVSPG